MQEDRGSLLARPVGRQSNPRHKQGAIHSHWILCFPPVTPRLTFSAVVGRWEGEDVCRGGGQTPSPPAPPLRGPHLSSPRCRGLAGEGRRRCGGWNSGRWAGGAR